MSAYSHNPNLCHGDLGPMAYRGHTLETALGGSISKFTYIWGQYPLSSLVMAMSSA
jgi:hypothetical protein